MKMSWDKLDIPTMLVHGFDMYRVYLSAPGDLDAEKQLCRSVISETNESDAMPSKILLVSVGLPQDGLVEQFRGVVADNIRQCTYYVQVFEDDWGPKNMMRKMFYLACDGRGDAALPMRDVVVFLKDASRETDPDILAFRKELLELADVRVVPFKTSDEMRAHLREITAGWVRQIRESAPRVAALAD